MIKFRLNGCAIAARLELAKPDKSRQTITGHFGQQRVRADAHRGVQAARDPGFDPSFRTDERRGAEPFHGGVPGRIVRDRRHWSTNARSSPSFDRDISGCSSSQAFRIRAPRPVNERYP